MSADDFTTTVLPVVGKRVFRIGLACNFGVVDDDVLAAVDRGVDYLYWPGGKGGRTEAAVRQVLRRDRDRMVLATGSGGPLGFPLRRKVEGVLRRLDTDYIDVFLLHWLGVTSWLNRSTLDTLSELRSQGRIRAIGVSIHDRQRAGQLAADSELDLMMLRYNAAHPGCERDVFPHLPEDRRAVVAYTATSWGKLLSAPAGWTGPVMTPADCYRFCLSNPAVHVVLTGPKTRAQLDENLGALARGPLSDEEATWMRDFGRAVHG